MNMTIDIIKQTRHRLEQFITPLLNLFGREERRTQGQFYLHGLLLQDGRKTAAQMATRYHGNEQALQQFVNQSPWDDLPVRKALARQMEPLTPAEAAWVLDDTGFKKQGKHSVGVARQYTGTLKDVGNCQVAVTLHIATDQGGYAVDTMLYLTEDWAADLKRRATVGIPPAVAFQTKWELGLALIDRARAWGLLDRVVLGDAAYGRAAELRAGLRERSLTYVLEVPCDTHLWEQETHPHPPVYIPGTPGKRPTKPVFPDSTQVKAFARSLPRSAWKSVSWRHGSHQCLKGRFAAVRIWPASNASRGSALEPESWLLIEWPAGASAPTHYWLSNLPVDTPLRTFVQWAKRRWWIEEDYKELKQQVGLTHFTGRSWRGWHHHMTLTFMALAFLVAEGYQSKKKGEGGPSPRPNANYRPCYGGC